MWVFFIIDYHNQILIHRLEAEFWWLFALILLNLRNRIFSDYWATVTGVFINIENFGTKQTRNLKTFSRMFRQNYLMNLATM